MALIRRELDKLVDKPLGEVFTAGERALYRVLVERERELLSP